MAADPSASTIDAQNPVVTLLHDLVRIPRPQLPSDDTTRTAAERIVRVVDGRLVRFKLESGRTGDQDYHLVITDDTLQYSPGGSGTTALEHSFVAEIVNPDCVGGRHGSVPTPSHLQAQMQAVYDKFLDQFPTITGGWNDADGIPVRVTGVTFFDRPHGQTGRALNDLELHPVLDIEFNPLTPVTPLPAPGTVTLTNPGFELGNQGWTATADVITTDNREPARTGNWKAWLGGFGVPHTDTLWQQVTLPTTATAITLEFYLHISTEEQALQVFDRLRVRLRRANGQMITTLKTYSNLQAAPGYALQTFSLTPYRGQTLRIELTSTEDNGSFTSFVIDDFRIIVE